MAMRLLVLISPKWSAKTAIRGDILLGSEELQEIKTTRTRKAQEGLSDLEVSNDSTSSKSCLETVKLLKSQYDQLLKDFKKSELMVLGNFMPQTPDLSFTSLDEFVNEHVVDNYKAISSEEEPKVVKKSDDAPVIEEWVLDSEEENVSQPKAEKKIVRPIIVKKEFVKSKQQDKTTRKTIKQVEKHSFDHLQVDCNYHQKQFQNQRMVKPVWNNAQRVNHQNFAKKTHPCAKKNMIPRAVLMKSGLVSINTARQNNFKTVVLVSTARHVNAAHSKTTVNAARPMSNSSKTTHSTVKMPIHKNTAFKNNYEEINGGYVAFEGNPKGGKITGKGGLTYPFAKATSDESKLWHRRLGHLNFKTMNKLVKGNLVRGLPSKLFENDQTCVACQKGKQHRASCKSKTENSISLPLHLLHMDLFGPTFVKSLMKKMYCLVVTDNYSSFTWVFFLATKDETSGILKSFITGIEYLVDHKIKVIRCDNGTEFKNREMSQFCKNKGILRQFSVARTPQQNRVAERRNRTLIEAARTMLTDSKLPTTFWAEVVNTACYVQNRVLVVKPHNKTPCELFHGRTPTLSFMRPFGYPVTFLNTIDHLGKFDGKADEGFFVGYFLNSKAFRVFNCRTRIVEENLHIRFSGNTPNVVGSGPDWLFDIDALTRTINMEPMMEITFCYHYGLLIPLYVSPIQRVSQDDESTPSSDDESRHKGDILLVQVYVDDIIFGSTKKELCNAFEKLMHEKFQMSSMGELTFFLGLQPLLKDENGEDVDVHMYMSMIGSLMYLTSSRPDIMFAVCACARYQVNPKVSHLHAMKRIFKYLKGQQKLGLWYPKYSLFDLVAYTDSDYAGASLDRKSTIRSCQFLGCRLIS
ncbi:putative ribonuclease H-like domain-containing protein [Tanacetum coccineum]